MSRIRQFFQYLMGKRSEASQLNYKDALMAKVVLDIHRKKQAKQTTMVPLFSLFQLHPLDRPNSLAATQQRANILQEHKQALVQTGHLTAEALDEIMPSVSAIKVVKKSATEWIAFEGNGRIAAMQQVFRPADQITVDVEEYQFRHPAKILRRLERIRSLHNLA